MHEAGRVDRARNLPLYWRVVLTNGLVFVVGTAALALSPATVSSRVLLSEAVVLAVGLTVILTTNALLLRRSLAALDRLTRKMHSVDLLRPDARLPETGTGTVADLVRSLKTVERHRANILRKLGMRDRTQLTRYAIRAGLIEP